ncbi:AT-hook motif nuclear-localized protein 18 [Vitis vinifera]|uniref:AT-hook motif nuclear-localized protein 18 n=1 Tax=Vitis vinifera TaxID=29760 RepID=A0A438H9E7_VITVI|nr:AT-hook motif nuclear-localized protein 18 [Vitis vinifera]
METNVSIKQPGPVGAFMTRHERFEILSLFGSFLPPLVPPGATGLTIFLVGGHGQVVGGSVVVELTAARLVIVPQSSGGKGGGGGGGVNNPFPDLWTRLLFFNLLLNMPNRAFAHASSGHCDGVITFDWFTSSEWVLISPNHNLDDAHPTKPLFFHIPMAWFNHILELSRLFLQRPRSRLLRRLLFRNGMGDTPSTTLAETTLGSE